MRFTDVRRVGARPEELWDALHDREVLEATIPGCDRLIPLGDREYAAILTAHVGGHEDTYRGLLDLTDVHSGVEVRLALSGRGKCGTLEVEVDLRLEPSPTVGTTLVRYDVRAWVDGLAQAGRARARSIGAHLVAGVIDDLHAVLDGSSVAV
jgi:carbon monoxide dehydrogenase subunit G